MFSHPVGLLILGGDKGEKAVVEAE